MKVGEKLDDVSGNIKRCLWCACVGSVCMCVAVVYVECVVYLSMNLYQHLLGKRGFHQFTTGHTHNSHTHLPRRTYCAGYSKSLIGLHFIDIPDPLNIMNILVWVGS